MKTIVLLGFDDARTLHTFECQDVVDGVAINPVLNPNFESTPNDQRDARDMAWLGVPFIRTESSDHPTFVAFWGGSLRYDVRCLDGGAWDRSTNHGQFSTLSEALVCANMAEGVAA